jgi:6-phosphogluconolactonase
VEIAIATTGRVHIFEDGAAMAEGAAENIAEKILEGIKARSRFSLALSGGTTPGATYVTLASGHWLLPEHWARVHIYFADERLVPPTDPESNFKLAKDSLVDIVGIPTSNVHRIRVGIEEMKSLVDDYEKILPSPLDLVILGIGADGHVASLFPDSPLLMETQRRVAAVTDAPKPPPRRITLTPAALIAARDLITLAKGQEKADVVARAIDGPESPMQCPGVLARRGEWFMDRAAAAGILRR